MADSPAFRTKTKEMLHTVKLGETAETCKHCLCRSWSVSVTEPLRTSRNRRNNSLQAVNVHVMDGFISEAKPAYLQLRAKNHSTYLRPDSIDDGQWAQKPHCFPFPSRNVPMYLVLDRNSVWICEASCGRSILPCVMWKRCIRSLWRQVPPAKTLSGMCKRISAATA